MMLKQPHKDWRLPQISTIDVRAVELEQLLTFLWLRIAHSNYPVTRFGAPSHLTVGDLVEVIERDDIRYPGFGTTPGAAEGWLRADLVYTRARRPNEVTVARPVHLPAARVRNPRETGDSFASGQVYAWLMHADPQLIDELHQFIDVQPGEGLDLPGLALALLAEEQPPDSRRPMQDESPPPLCWKQATDFTEDLRNLLAYRRAMPRAALVEHMQRLTGLHLGLYMLRLFRTVPQIAGSGGKRTCDRCTSSDGRSGQCGADLEILVDCGEEGSSAVAKLAEAAWAREDEHVSRYVRSHLALKKLHEFAEEQRRRGNAREATTPSVEEVAEVELNADRPQFDAYFAARIENLRLEAEGDDREQIDEIERHQRQLGLSPFQVYVGLLTHFSEKRWVSYHRWLVDSLLGKNSRGGLLRQPLGGKRRRRASLSPGLLETLTLIAVVTPDGGVARTSPIRIDQLITRFRERYGLLIAEPPIRDQLDPSVVRALAENVLRFRSRLRETGLFTDLSDAYLAQTVRPRIEL